MPKSVVIDPEFDWEGDRHLETPVARHGHLRNARQGLHDAASGRARGPPRHVRRARVRAGGRAPPVARCHRGRAPADPPDRPRELPARPRADELLGLLVDRLSRARTRAYAATGDRGEQVREFKGMVKALHRAGIEVILDVVYNHTAEGNHLGPMLAFRGIDNVSYYRLMPGRPAVLHGLHGHGQLAQPGAPERAAADHGLAALLRRRVPRRRLPLRPRLGARARVLRRRPAVGLLRRHPPGPDRLAGEADRRAVGRRAGRLPGRQLPDPLERVERDLPRLDARLLARSGPGRRLRAAVHRARATCTSEDGRRPFASINFVTAHDGFTLADLVSYNDKHNEANGEESRDGTDDNRSWNCGAEGPTDDAEIASSFASGSSATSSTTLFLSQGVPMLLGGDELGRTQHGNNNAWCQDNELSWFDWQLDEPGSELLDFTRRVDRVPRRAPDLPPRGRSSPAARRATRACPTCGGSAPTAGR